ncbi:MAG: hypothetical protein AAF423_00760 [Pseudomonadota bacterium]
MRFNSIALLLATGLFTAVSGQAMAKASCQNMDNLISDLDILANALESSGSTPSRQLDADLRALVVDAKKLAKAENDTGAIHAVNGMIDGWNDGDADLYLRNSDFLASRLEYFVSRDC